MEFPRDRFDEAIERDVFGPAVVLAQGTFTEIQQMTGELYQLFRVMSPIFVLTQVLKMSMFFSYRCSKRISQAVSGAFVAEALPRGGGRRVYAG